MRISIRTTHITKIGRPLQCLSFTNTLERGRLYVDISRKSREFTKNRGHISPFSDRGQSVAIGRPLALAGVMLRIQRVSRGQVTFSLSGRMEVEDVDELRRLISLESPHQQLCLDLKDITLVDREGLKFLESCEQQNIRLENCPAYIREWIGTKRCRI